MKCFQDRAALLQTFHSQKVWAIQPSTKVWTSIGVEIDPRKCIELGNTQNKKINKQLRSEVAAINDNIFHYGNRAKILQCHILHIWSNYCFNGKYKICFVQSDGTSCSFGFRVKPVSVFVRMAEFFIFGHLYSIYRSRHGFIKVKTKWKAPF